MWVPDAQGACCNPLYSNTSLETSCLAYGTYGSCHAIITRVDCGIHIDIYIYQDEWVVVLATESIYHSKYVRVGIASGVTSDSWWDFVTTPLLKRFHIITMEWTSFCEQASISIARVFERLCEREILFNEAREHVGNLTIGRWGWRYSLTVHVSWNTHYERLRSTLVVTVRSEINKWNGCRDPFSSLLRVETTLWLFADS